MVSTTYSTGSWLGIVRSGSVVVLDGQTDPEIVNHLWNYLGQEPTIHGVLNEVTEKFGTGLTGMPDFAVVVQSDRLHAILRGDITLLAHSEAGTELVSGRDVTTWSERSLPLADSIELTLAEPGVDHGTLVLPLGEGVVRLQALTILAGAAGRRIANTYDVDEAATVPSGAEAVPPAGDAQLFVADATPFAGAPDNEAAPFIEEAPFSEMEAGADVSGDDAPERDSDREQESEPEWAAEPENPGEASQDVTGDSVPDSTVSDNTVPDDSEPENTVPDDILLDNTVPEIHVADDSLSENPVADDSLSEIPVADDSESDSFGIFDSIDESPAEPEPALLGSSDEPAADFDAADESPDAESVSAHNEQDAIYPDPGNPDLGNPEAENPDAHEPDAGDLAGAGVDEADPDDDETLASFAKAAEAADAEWNAQLAPMDAAAHHGAEDDLSLTIRPDMGDEMDQSDDTAEAEEPEQEQELEPEEAAGEREAADSSPPTADGKSATAAEEPVDDGFTINYDYLFGATTMAQSVEAAAVRLDENGQPVRPENLEPVLPPRPPQPPMAGSGEAGPSGTGMTADSDVPADGGWPGASDDSAGGDLQAHAPGEAPAPEGAPFPTQAGEPESLLIDSVPWSNTGSRAEAANAQSAQAGPADYVTAQSAQETAGQYDPALDDPALGAAAAAGDAVTPSNGSVNNGGNVNGGYDPDHDGHTVVRGDFSRDGQPAAAAPLESRPPTGPMVLARMCPNGHANPPSRAQCSGCGAAINSEPREVGRPRLGTMHISTGELVELDHSLIIGRQPSVSRVMGGAMPRLVQVKSGNDDISRSHVEVRLDGWEVLLVDLKATNGTVLVREGQAPRRLSQGEEAILLNGDIAELGDGVSLLFDGLL